MRGKASVLVLFPIFFLFAGGCGRQEAQRADSPGDAGPAQPAVQTPEALGQALGAAYIEILEQVVAILDERQPAEETQARLTDLKARTIERLVEMGRAREAMPEEGRATVDRILSRRIMTVPGDLFKAYQEGRTHYQGDRELVRLIADFNIITQYANFDLLKKQLPAEAERLGL